MVTHIHLCQKVCTWVLVALKYSMTQLSHTCIPISQMASQPITSKHTWTYIRIIRKTTCTQVVYSEDPVVECAAGKENCFHGSNIILHNTHLAANIMQPLYIEKCKKWNHIWSILNEYFQRWHIYQPGCEDVDDPNCCVGVLSKQVMTKLCISIPVICG